MNNQNSINVAVAHLRAYAPYLEALLAKFPELPEQLKTTDAERLASQLRETFATPESLTWDKATLMERLRTAKARMALLTALADVAGLWPLETVTRNLSAFAQTCLTLSTAWLLHEAHTRGELVLPHPEDPARDSGLIVLAMGKLGADELNYSSDIDLTLFYEREKIGYRGRQNVQHALNKLAQDLVHLMQERTRDGYVFRTDLRLCPDPASMPPAISVDAAMQYYESVGQNWERAAMIKARPIAGDLAAGEHFLKQLSPFMWRRSLDFAAVQDIHSIKRQMESKTGTQIEPLGHNIKIGIGGIREIEFFVQVNQLIWGGREPALRLRGTCDTLLKLTELNHIAAEDHEILRSAYVFLRTLEHRLQMVADAQTHSLPNAPEDYTQIARFMGYAEVTVFTQTLLMHLNAVHTIFAAAHNSSEKLGAEGKLVFTGVSPDPETLETLRSMGYREPESIATLIMSWHHGGRRCTRTKRARELITELTPAMLQALAATPSPDEAFHKFDQFLAGLPAGVQLFSLFTAYPGMLTLIAEILGSAPLLASILSKHPDLLDAVLDARFYGALPNAAALHTQLISILAVAQDEEDRLDMLRRFKNEKQFQAGVQLLKGLITHEQAGAFLSTLAELLVQQTLATVEQQFVQAYGKIQGAQFAILALGKLGSREMTFASDIDLVFIYDVPDFETISDGSKSFSASVYYNRMSQRLLSALTVMSKEGVLYEADTRLRPSGKQGLLAVSFAALQHYFQELAWTFELMALTRARPIAGAGELCAQLEQHVRTCLSQPHDAAKIKHDALEMRARVEAEYPPLGTFDLKYARGGLMDIDFLIQAYALMHQQLPPAETALIEESHRFQMQLYHIVRLFTGDRMDEAQAGETLKQSLANAMHEPSFGSLKEKLEDLQKRTYIVFHQLLKEAL